MTIDLTRLDRSSTIVNRPLLLVKKKTQVVRTRAVQAQDNGQNKRRPRIDAKALAKHKRRFLKFFPKGFDDERYEQWERAYKWEAHKLWQKTLGKKEFARLLAAEAYDEIASRALKVEAGTTFLFSFEKMALRDALKTSHGARIFAQGIYELLYGKGEEKERFVAWIISVSQLPRIKARVLSWPILTLFPYLAQPEKYMILKPTAMRFASSALGYELDYSSKPSWRTYESLIDLAEQVRSGITDLGPRNYHDLQTFLWVIGSAEYERLEEEL